MSIINLLPFSLIAKSPFSAPIVILAPNPVTISPSPAGMISSYVKPLGRALQEEEASLLFFFFNFFSTFIYFWDRERQSMNGGGAEREGDTESETGYRL